MFLIFLKVSKLKRGENDLLTKCPDIADEWNYEKNNGLKPSANLTVPLS